MINSPLGETEANCQRITGHDVTPTEGPRTGSAPADSSPETKQPLSFLEARLDLRILQALRRIIRAVEVHSRKLEARYDVTSAQLLCLMAVKERGPLTLSGIARNLFISSSTLVGIVDRLERKGWVVRRRGTEDRRQVSISLTDPGRLLLESAPSPLQDHLAEALKDLPELEQVAIAMSLERVVGLMESGVADAAGPSHGEVGTDGPAPKRRGDGSGRGRRGRS
jgi:DNA-binding MarR family transcriptional regulator